MDKKLVALLVVFLVGCESIQVSTYDVETSFSHSSDDDTVKLCELLQNFSSRYEMSPQVPETSDVKCYFYAEDGHGHYHLVGARVIDDRIVVDVQGLTRTSWYLSLKSALEKYLNDSEVNWVYFSD